jgi:predicted RNase H-like nuclease
MTWVAGIDGCEGGWFAILRNVATGVFEYTPNPLVLISEIINRPEQPEVVAVDIPIGLLDAAQHGGRQCDRDARRLLGQPRSNSVFPPPVRSALPHDVYENASRANRESSPPGIGISQQAFALRHKILEVDEWIGRVRDKCVWEVHPEVCFYAANGRKSMQYGKKKKNGRDERRNLLNTLGYGSVIDQAYSLHGREIKRDDILDACIACWTAERIFRGEAESVGGSHSQIWY